MQASGIGRAAVEEELARLAAAKASPSEWRAAALRAYEEGRREGLADAMGAALKFFGGGRDGRVR